MAVPVIEAADTVWSGSGTIQTSLSIGFPGYSSGDLVLVHVGCDAGATFTFQATGPNGETVVTIYDDVEAPNVACRAAAFYWIGTGTVSAGNVTVTLNSARQWVATSVRVPSGEFDGTTPIDSSNSLGQNTDDCDSPTLSVTNANCRLCFWACIDQQAVTATPSGWSDLQMTDVGAVTGLFSVRDSGTSSSESVPTYTWTLGTADSTATIIYAINEAAASEFTATVATVVPAVTSAVAASHAVPAFTSTVAATTPATVSAVAASHTTPSGGPLDAISEVAHCSFGLYKKRAAYAGDCLRVRRSSDDSEQDIGWDGGWIDIAALETFVGAGDGYVVTLYDQGPDGIDASQSTASLQPLIAESGEVCRTDDTLTPCIRCKDGRYLSGELTTPAQSLDISVSFVGRKKRPIGSDSLVGPSAIKFTSTSDPTSTAYNKHDLVLNGTRWHRVYFGGTSGYVQTGDFNRVGWHFRTDHTGVHINTTDCRILHRELWEGANPRDASTLGSSLDMTHFHLGYGNDSTRWFELVALTVTPCMSSGDRVAFYNASYDIHGIGINHNDIPAGSLFDFSFDWERTIYDWLAAIQESDVTMPTAALSWDGTYASPEALYEIYRRTYEAQEGMTGSITQFMRNGPEWFVLDDGAGGGIEATGDLRLEQRVEGYTATTLDYIRTGLYDLSLPDGGGEGNAYYQHSGLAHRLMVGALSKMLVMAEGGLATAGLMQDIYQGAWQDIPSTINALSGILDAGTLAAAKKGVMEGVQNVQLGTGPNKHDQSNMSLRCLVFLASAYNLMDGDSVAQQKIVETAKLLCFGAIDGTQATAIRGASAVAVAGYSPEAGTPDGQYQGQAMNHVAHAWAIKHDGDFSFVQDVLDAMCKLSFLHYLGDERATTSAFWSGDSIYFKSESGTNGRTPGGWTQADGSTTSKELIQAVGSTYGRPSIRNYKGADWQYARSTSSMVSRITTSLSAIENALGTAYSAQPLKLLYQSGMHWPADEHSTIPAGYYATFEGWISGEESTVIPPLLRGATNELLGNEFWFYRDDDSGGQGFAFIVECSETQGRYNSQYSGALHAFWVENVGPVVLSRRRDTATDPGGRPWSETNGGWAGEGIWAETANGYVCSLGTLNDKCSPSATHNTGGSPPSVSVESTFGQANTGNTGNAMMEDGDELTGGYTITNSYTATDSGVRIQHVITRDSGTDNCTQIWWSLPLLVGDTQTGRYTAAEPTMHYWNGSTWVAFTPDNATIETSSVRFGQDFDGGGLSYWYVHFDSVRPMRMNERLCGEAHTTFTRNLEVDLHPNTGVSTQWPSSIDITVNLSTQASNIWTSTVAATTPAVTSAISATMVPPSADAAVAATVPAVTSAVSAAHTVPSWTGWTVARMPAVTTSVAASHIPANWDAAVAATMPAVTSAAVAEATTTPEDYTATVACTLPAVVAEINARKGSRRKRPTVINKQRGTTINGEWL